MQDEQEKPSHDELLHEEKLEEESAEELDSARGRGRLGGLLGEAPRFPLLERGDVFSRWNASFRFVESDSLESSDLTMVSVLEKLPMLSDECGLSLGLLLLSLSVCR